MTSPTYTAQLNKKRLTHSHKLILRRANSFNLLILISLILMQLWWLMRLLIYFKTEVFVKSLASIPTIILLNWYTFTCTRCSPSMMIAVWIIGSIISATFVLLFRLKCKLRLFIIELCLSWRLLRALCKVWDWACRFWIDRFLLKFRPVWVFYNELSKNWEKYFEIVPNTFERALFTY